MLRKLLFVIAFICSLQFAYTQAPGANSSSPTQLVLSPGNTITTGLQTTVGLGNDYDGAAAVCGAFPGFADNGEDGVYSFEVIIPGDHVFSFINSAGTNTYNVLTVHSATPITDANCLGGIYTAGASAGTNTINLGSGVYYIRIDSAPFGGAFANFELEIESPAANDSCLGAVEVWSNVNCLPQTYSNSGAGDSGVANPGCASYTTGDVWFSYEVNSTGEVTIQTTAGTITDTGLAVYDGTCGGTLNLIQCDDDSGTGAYSSITLTGRTPGETLYIRVWDHDDGAGTFGLCITTPVPAGTNGVRLNCPGEYPRELTSDLACTPGSISSSTISGNLLGQPTADRLVATTVSTDACPGVFAAGSPRRYETIDFTVPVTGVYVFNTDVSTGFDNQGYIVVDDGLFVPGSCATGTYVAGDDDSSGSYLFASQVTATLTAGVNYTFITTEYGPSTANRPYLWNITGPGVPLFTGIVPPIDWYTTAVGGTAIGSGFGFNPVGVAGSGLPDTDTPGVYSFWAECPTNPGRVQADFIIGKVWTAGSGNSNWNDAGNWSEGTIPTNDQCVCINATANDPIINDNETVSAYAITVKNGASITLTSDLDTNNFGAAIVLQDYVEVETGGTFTIQDGASLIQVLDYSAFPFPTSANSGDIDLSRNVDISRLDYVYWSSPVQGFDVSNIYAGFTPTNHIYEWTPTMATGYLGMPGNVPIEAGNWNPISSGSMDRGKGYIVRGPTNFSTAVSTATSQFSGVANNGVIRQALSSGSYSGGPLLYNPYGTDNLNITNKDDNWNLLGNPYPSALDADAFLMNNSLIEGAVHIWTHGTALGSNGDSFYDDFLLTYSPNDYITYNLTGVTNPNPTFSGNIASGQGFFVLALNDNESGNVTFTNSMRSSTVSNTDFYRSSEPSEDNTAVERHRIWLDFISNDNNTSSSALVGYVEGATQEKDRLYDAYAREANYLSIFSNIDDERMIIQGRALPFNDSDLIPVGVVAPDNGQYTIAISGVDGLFSEENQNIYLEDTYLNTIHNLRLAPYTFNVEDHSEDFSDRFVLRFTNDALGIDDVSLNPIGIIAPKGDYIKVNAEISPINTITVFDLLGRTLINKTNVNANEFYIKNHNLVSGSYIVNVVLENGAEKSQKVILKQ